jgi:putative NIF3 family GTP cyclohydrolase 1 type 2
MGEVPEQPLESFLNRVKTLLGCEGLRYVNSCKAVKKVCVGGGSCGGFVSEAAKLGCDTFVTADVKYNQFRTAYELGINLIDAGHFHTENPTMPIVAEKLRKAFPGVEVIFSEKHQDVMRFY